MSNASDVLDRLRAAGMRLGPVEKPAEDKNDIEFQFAEEVAVCSINVEKTNYDAVRLLLTDIDRDEENLKATINMLVEAVCMLRDEIGQIRLSKWERDL
jgi:hypothetical protein